MSIMPFINDAEYNKLLKRLEALEKKTEGIKNSPLITAYPTKKFTLNDHLDVLKLNKNIEALSKSVALAVDVGSGITTVAEDLRWHRVSNELILEKFNQEFQRWDSTGYSILF
jgi:hypothetical protein